MKVPIQERTTGKMTTETVYFGGAIQFLYGTLLGTPIAALLSCIPLFSHYVGWLQRRPASRRKIVPFIEAQGIDTAEFADPVDSFTSFDAFFTRQLKPEARPITPGAATAVLPADGRYTVFPDVSACERLSVKGKPFTLRQLLQDNALAERYAQGTLVFCRLAPPDLHWFYFPCDGLPGKTHMLNGPLYSVNPLALKQRFSILCENKRTLCRVQTEQFGELLYLEVGATNVGTIHETYTPHRPIAKGEPKGYFSFGGSALLLLFEPGKITLAADLVAASAKGIEIRGLLGQPLGVSKSTV